MNSWRLLAALSLGVFLVGLQVESWVLISGMFFILWKGAIEFWKLEKPSRWLTNFLTLAFLAILILKYKTVLNQDSSASFLVLLTSLKLLEERGLRDQKFLFLLGFILISSLFLFSLEAPGLLGGFCCFFLLWSAQGQEIKYSPLFARALPFTLLLFLFFPRLQNPFGLQGFTSSQGTTGFSEGLNPGSIAKIQNSKELAFRVHFTNEKKYHSRDQYWRGQVLNFSEGLRWTRASSGTLERIFAKPAQLDYEVTLEPHGKKWLFILETTQGLQAASFPFVLKKGHYFESVAPLYQRTAYQGALQAAGREDVPAAETKSELQVPEVSEKVHELVRSFSAKTTSRDALAQAILNYFQEQKFTYSKNPGEVSEQLENFLFKTKKGYCEHYAASFATLLRLARIPSRVVTGYQGGEFNAYGGFWKFTQADAHAWAEFLNEKNQWVRVDPTSAVAPERLELGGVLFADLPEAWIGQNKTLDYLNSRTGWWVRARESAVQSLESLNYDLVLFLIDFNLEKQKELLKENSFALAGLGTLLLLPFLLQSLYRRRRPSSAAWLLGKLEEKAEKQQLRREPSETLRHFILRWTAAKPSQKAPLQSLLRIYETEVYTAAATRPNRRMDRQRVRRLFKELKD